MIRLVPILFVLMIPGLIRAQALTPKDLDARIENQLYDVLKLGTDVYNRGGHDACFRLYQGSLMTLTGFLDHRPDVLVKVQKALKDTDNLTNVSERAHALREAIDELRGAIKTTYAPKVAGNTPQMPPTPPVLSNRKVLWDRLGGEISVTLLVEDFVARVIANPRVNFTRKGTGQQWDPNPENLTKLKRQLVTMLSSVTGGPMKYEGKDMKSAHNKMKITAAEFDALTVNFKESLDKFFVPPAEKQELLQLLEGTRKDIVDPTMIVKPLWERLGGEASVALIVDDFVNRSAKNPLVNITRKGVGKEWTGNPEQVVKLKRQLVTYVSSITGGPLKYDGQAMKPAHAGMKISEAEFDAMAQDLRTSLEQFKVNFAEQEELFQLLKELKKDIVERK